MNAYVQIKTQLLHAARRLVGTNACGISFPGDARVHREKPGRTRRLHYHTVSWYKLISLADAPASDLVVRCINRAVMNARMGIARRNCFRCATFLLFYHRRVELINNIIRCAVYSWSNPTQLDSIASFVIHHPRVSNGTWCVLSSMGANQVVRNVGPGDGKVWTISQTVFLC